MNKLKVSNKYINSNFETIINVNELKVIKNFNSAFYNVGVYGWNYDCYVYNKDCNICFIDSYRNSPKRTIYVPYAIKEKYNKQYEKEYTRNIWNKSFEELQEIAQNILDDFVKEVIERGLF